MATIRICPQGHPVSDSSLGFCVECGAKLIDQEVSTGASSSLDSNNFSGTTQVSSGRPTGVRCPKCGSMISSDDRFCSVCGYDRYSVERVVFEKPRVSAITESQAIKPADKTVEKSSDKTVDKKSGKTWLFALLGIVGIVLIVVGILVAKNLLGDKKAETGSLPGPGSDSYPVEEGSDEIEIPVESEDGDSSLIYAYSDLEIGDYCYFGKYEQDNISENGEEAIEWIVLDLLDNDTKALLISRTCFEQSSFNKDGNTDWSTSYLHNWLNDWFWKEAFSDAEKDLIVNVKVPTSYNPETGKDSGEESVDKVWILSYEEADRYFNQLHREHVCGFSTRYLEKRTTAWIANGVVNPNNVYAAWWLRTPGIEAENVALIEPTGGFAKNGHTAYSNQVAVRPCVVISIK